MIYINTETNPKDNRNHNLNPNCVIINKQYDVEQVILFPLTSSIRFHNSDEMDETGQVSARTKSRPTSNLVNIPAESKQ